MDAIFDTAWKLLVDYWPFVVIVFAVAAITEAIKHTVRGVLRILKHKTAIQIFDQVIILFPFTLSAIAVFYAGVFPADTHWIVSVSLGVLGGVLAVALYKTLLKRIVEYVVAKFDKTSNKDMA